MLVRYKYRHCDCGNIGWFQCDEEDFKNLWKNKAFQDGLYWCVVQKQGEDFYHIFSKAVNRWYKSGKRCWF